VQTLLQPGACVQTQAVVDATTAAGAAAHTQGRARHQGKQGLFALPLLVHKVTCSNAPLQFDSFRLRANSAWAILAFRDSL
jgi:hypothetical protein